MFVVLGILLQSLATMFGLGFWTTMSALKINFILAKINNSCLIRFRSGPMDLRSIMFVPTQLALEMEDVIWKIMMWLATMMVVIAVPIKKRLKMEFVMKKTKTKSVTLMGWTAAKTGNQLVIGFAMLKMIMNIVTLMEKIVVLIFGLEMVFVVITTIIQSVVPMMGVIAVWMSRLQITALIANAMKIACPSAM